MVIKFIKFRDIYGRRRHLLVDCHFKDRLLLCSLLADPKVEVMPDRLRLAGTIHHSCKPFLCFFVSFFLFGGGRGTDLVTAEIAREETESV